ncbi:MAG: sarcosine oxidase subunit gamma family protein [Paracoccus sp. (in: a-proteobacteria)]|uniref:sarcosine oxidase subunit gamma n=1 Tax=Paracoccus sp. TaxID=267 RepID=UPI0039E43ECF
MAEALARITELADLGMIQIRADLGGAGDAIRGATGLAVPAPVSTVGDGTRTLVWMSPDELLLVLPAADTAQALAALTQALAPHHALVLDVGDMRRAFAVEGPRAAQVLMKLSPADIASMPPDGARRSRAGQVACGIWRTGEGFVVIGFRSVGDYIAGLLQGAARVGSQLDPR